jgi:hypothetical protein
MPEGMQPPGEHLYTDRMADKAEGLHQVDPGPAEVIAAIRSLAANAHNHQWDVIDVWSPPAPVHPRDRNVSVTHVLIKCVGCGMPATTELDGRWTLTQILDPKREP